MPISSKARHTFRAFFRSHLATDRLPVKNQLIGVHGDLQLVAAEALAEELRHGGGAEVLGHDAGPAAQHRPGQQRAQQALPMPAQVAAMPYFHPNCPA